MDIEKTIREYLPEIVHLSLATCAHGKPWVCEVHYVYDDDLNLYFLSRTNTRHGKDIAIHREVAGSIVVQHKIDDEVRGVYFEGKAELIEKIDTNHVAYKLYSERFNTNESVIAEAQEPDGHQFYKITVSEFSVFDSKESNPSQKYSLPWKG